MGTFVLSNLFIKFLNVIVLLTPFVFLYQDSMTEYYEQQTALIERNKQAFLWIVWSGVALINAWVQYEKMLYSREKRRELKLNNDIKEKELKEKKNEKE